GRYEAAPYLQAQLEQAPERSRADVPELERTGSRTDRQSGARAPQARCEAPVPCAGEVVPLGSRPACFAFAHDVHQPSLARWLSAEMCSTQARRSRCSRFMISCGGQWKW